jgi:predicted P-loop ATPase
VVFDEAYRNSFHPVREYLDGLQWDGVKRIDTWLVDYADAEASEFVCEVGALMLVAAVRRVRSPGCKFDEMPVLQSVQGFNKSTALSILAVRPEWFSDDLPLRASFGKE